VAVGIRGLMRACIAALSIASVLVIGTGPLQAAVQFPFTITFDAQLTSGVTTINTKVTMTVQRPMADVIRTRVTDALLHGGYSNFLGVLRPVAAVGSIKSPSNTVEIKYTREFADSSGPRLILIADHPIFFLNSDPAKPRTGFDLTVVDLRFDDKGGVTGQMAGAARVRPAPDGTVLLDTYVEERVELKGRLTPPK
jgi:hypothetical protein